MNTFPRGMLPVLSIALAAFAVGHLQTAITAQSPPVPPIELVKRTVQNEIRSNSDDTKFMFRVRRETPRGSQTRLMVQTSEAIAAVTVAVNDRPLSPQQLHAEEARLQRLVENPDELGKKLKQEKDDAERVTRIMKALPDAFLYEYAGIEQGRRGVGKEGDELVHLSFRPNPDSIRRHGWSRFSLECRARFSSISQCCVSTELMARWPNKSDSVGAC